MSYTKFKERTEKPGQGNDFYIKEKTVTVGLNTAVKGNPIDTDCDVLSNCVGYAQGRFNEIHYEITGKKENICKTFNCNAENFIQKGQSLGFVIGDVPRAGAIICWQKGDTLSGSDGAGHVAVVESVIDENTIVTSESAYGGSAFFTKTRKKGSDGLWGQKSPYKFRGFIYHPDVIEETSDSEKTYTPGDIVQFLGGYHYASANTTSGKEVKACEAKITAIYKIGKAKHPYHLVHTGKSGVYGWVDKDSFK